MWQVAYLGAGAPQGCSGCRSLHSLPISETSGKVWTKSAAWTTFCLHPSPPHSISFGIFHQKCTSRCSLKSDWSFQMQILFVILSPFVCWFGLLSFCGEFWGGATQTILIWEMFLAIARIKSKGLSAGLSSLSNLQRIQTALATDENPRIGGSDSWHQHFWNILQV